MKNNYLNHCRIGPKCARIGLSCNCVFNQKGTGLMKKSLFLLFVLLAFSACGHSDPVRPGQNGDLVFNISEGNAIPQGDRNLGPAPGADDAADQVVACEPAPVPACPEPEQAEQGDDQADVGVQDNPVAAWQPNQVLVDQLTFPSLGEVSGMRDRDGTYHLLWELRNLDANLNFLKTDFKYSTFTPGNQAPSAAQTIFTSEGNFNVQQMMYVQLLAYKAETGVKLMVVWAERVPPINPNNPENRLMNLFSYTFAPGQEAAGQKKVIAEGVFSGRNFKAGILPHTSKVLVAYSQPKENGFTLTLGVNDVAAPDNWIAYKKTDIVVDGQTTTPRDTLLTLLETGGAVAVVSKSSAAGAESFNLFAARFIAADRAQNFTPNDIFTPSLNGEELSFSNEHTSLYAWDLQANPGSEAIALAWTSHANNPRDKRENISVAKISTRARSRWIAIPHIGQEIGAIKKLSVALTSSKTIAFSSHETFNSNPPTGHLTASTFENGISADTVTGLDSRSEYDGLLSLRNWMVVPIADDEQMAIWTDHQEATNRAMFKKTNNSVWPDEANTINDGNIELYNIVSSATPIMDSDGLFAGLLSIKLNLNPGPAREGMRIGQAESSTLSLIPFY